jgi:hypothetical protein
MRRVMMFMPLVFVLVVIRFPAGVLVYWITTNTWTIGQQYVVKRRMGPLQAATAGAAAGTGGGSGPPGAALPSSAESSKTTKATAGRAREKLPAGKGAAGGSAAKSGAGKGAAGKSTPGKSTASKPATTGNGSPAGGLGALIRSKVKPEDKPAPVATAQRDGPPPKPPRKKKKRSGRRR